MTVDFKAIANNSGANVVSQAAWLALLTSGGALQNGFQAGVAQSAQVNKALRQASVMAAAVAQAVSDITGQDVLDNDGDAGLAAIVTQLKLAMTKSAFRTGDVLFSMVAHDYTLIPGWVFLRNGTIGSAASSATERANADTAALYDLLWGLSNGDTVCPVVGGRGASSVADFAANKPITLPRTAGRVFAGRNPPTAPNDPTLTSHLRGDFVGEETHTQTAAEVGPHTHSIHYFSPGTAPGGQTGFMNDQVDAVSKATDTGTAGGTPFNVMQPTVFMTAIMKL